MSWSASGIAKLSDAAGAELEITSASPPLDTEWAPEPAEAFELAKQTVLDLVESGKLGGPGHEFTVTIAGHANPGHEPVEGWANDCVSIHVSQRSS